MPCPNCRCSSCLALIGSTVPSAEFSLPSPDFTTVNRAPTNVETAYSRDVIHSSQNIVSMIQATVGDLEKRKIELLDLVSKHKAAISPLRWFPPELLVEIFVVMVKSYWRSKDFPPLMLAGVCSRWRRVVLDTPQLWTKILTAHPMIDSWIARSKELPLHLELDLRRSHPTLEALVPHSHRWQSAGFHLRLDSRSILARVKNRLHSLKKLDLYFGHTSGTVDFCEVAPQLTEIILCGIRHPFTIKLPWDQMRVCALDNGEVAHYILQNAENLQELQLNMSKMPMDGPPELDMPIGPHSLHTKLRFLIAKWNFRDPGVNLFFSSITLPSLQTLHFHFDYLLNVDQAEFAPILVRFFEQSCAHLGQLKLTNIPLSPSALIKCLAFSPSLVFLDIEFNNRWYTIDGELLDGLSLNHPRHVLPHLRSLTFRGPADMCIEEPMDALIASRRHIDPKHDGVATLENLTLECTPSRVEEPRPPRFHRFVSEGLNIVYGKDWGL